MKQKLLCFLTLGILLIGSAYAQDRTISGKVTSAEDGSPITGVSVSAVGTTAGTQTNEQGEYVLTVPSSAAALQFMYLGYTTQTVDIGSSNVINAVLESDEQALDEVVVTALGIQRKRNELPYAAQTIRSEEVTRTRDPNFTNALSGKIAGLDIKQPNTMGGSTNVIIRGYKSITGNNQALFVVDGTPISNVTTNTTDQTTGRGGFDYGNAAADINPDDIASINVLKGPAATALYGSRAANGVIMITTKKGTKGTLDITLNSGVTFGHIDKSTFAKYQKEYGAGYVNEYTKRYLGDDAAYGSPDGNFWYEDVFGQGESLVTPFTEDASYGAAFDPNLLVYQWNAFDTTSSVYGQPTPWVAGANDPSTFYKGSVNSTHSLSITGGSEKTVFKAGYTRVDETGVLPNSKITRNQFGFSGGHEISDKLKVSADANFTKINGLGRYGTGYDGANPNQQFRQWWQTNVDIKEQKAAFERQQLNQTWNWADMDIAGPIYSNNPYWNRYKSFNNDSRDRYFGNATLTYSPLDWLEVVGRVTFDGSNEFQEERIAIGGADVPAYSRFDRTYSETNVDLLLNFTHDITSDISFRGLLGTNMRRNYLSSIDATTNGGLIVEDLFSLSNSINPINAPIERFERVGVDGVFASVTFGYKELFLLDGTLRRDQSTTLPAGNNIYWYPSVAGTFIFSNLMPESTWLSYGKLRLNYAQVGADAPALALADTYVMNPLFDGRLLGSVALSRANSDIRPEQTKSVEAGLDMSFWNARTGFELTFYRSTTFDQIMPIDVSNTTGYGRRWINAGDIQNQGMEVAAFVVPVRRPDFSWTLNLNLARNQNKVVDLYEDSENLQLATFQGGITLNATKGEPFGTLRGVDYVFDNGQKVVGEDGYYLTSPANQVIGDINPDWTGGVQNLFKYKDFGLSFSVDGKIGGDVFSLDQYYGMATGLYPETAGLNDLGNPKRVPIEDGGGVILPGVKEDGTPNDIRVEAYDNGTTPYGYSNNPQAGFVYDASFIKLREVSLTYSLPAVWMAASRAFKGIDVSLIGRNLWIIHKNVPYSDPEEGLSAGNFQGVQSGAYPAVRSLGFNVRFRF
ncbi:SusC/RagA family TonB-linked outer membrane protein [Parapedobacter sp. DT-150]|uniref:SusC/RagA family TonB-linked outer membrane protein n=1 Tax=Parapedobacter sp. DT-150 TaxID=3396162 RepID=UPI003F1B7E1E